MRLFQMAVRITLCALIFAVYVNCQTTLTEPSTEKTFPTEVKLTYDAKDYALKCTGLAVRKKLFFKVYGMAHYIEGMNPVKNEDEAYSAILSEGRAKQIIMTFVRNVDAKTICNTYNEGFKNNASEAEYNELKPLIDKFLGFFTKDVKENDQFLYKWMPDGNVIAVINNEEKPAIFSKLFARTLWSIWFGKDSVVDREDLVARMIGKN